MTAIKERIIGALALMNDTDAEKVWSVIQDTFTVKERERTWDDIETEEPDEIDLIMLKEVEENPDCKEFVSAKEAYKELGL